MKKRMNCYGQLQMSYSMIFSIFLIAIFIFVAFIAINAFLDIKKTIDSGSLIRDLRNDVDRVWRGAGEDIIINYSIEGGELSYLCFFNASKSVSGNFELIGEEIKKSIPNYNHNLYFFPRKSADVYSVEIEHIDMEAFSSNPYCIPRVKEQFTLKIKKDLRDSLVRIE